MCVCLCVQTYTCIHSNRIYLTKSFGKLISYCLITKLMSTCYFSDPDTISESFSKRNIGLFTDTCFSTILQKIHKTLRHSTALCLWLGMAICQWRRVCSNEIKGNAAYLLECSVVTRNSRVRITAWWRWQTLEMSEKAVAPHSSSLAWKIPWTEEPGRL